MSDLRTPAQLRADRDLVQRLPAASGPVWGVESLRTLMLDVIQTALALYAEREQIAECPVIPFEKAAGPPPGPPPAHVNPAPQAGPSSYQQADRDALAARLAAVERERKETYQVLRGALQATGPDLHLADMARELDKRKADSENRLQAMAQAWREIQEATKITAVYSDIKRAVNAKATLDRLAAEGEGTA